MYYKFRTHSTSPITKEVDPSTNNTVTVYHLERFLPVFSHHIFASKGIDAKKNYEFSILTLRGREITGSMCRMQVLKNTKS